MDHLVVILLFALASVTAHATDTTEGTKPVFVRGQGCDGKLSSVAFSALAKEFRNSTKYRPVRGVDDEGRRDTVLLMYMNCAERNDALAIAVVYGWGRCLNDKDCVGTVDGHSVRSALCDATATAECGRVLFRAFDDYMGGHQPPGHTVDPARSPSDELHAPPDGQKPERQQEQPIRQD